MARPCQQEIRQGGENSLLLLLIQLGTVPIEASEVMLRELAQAIGIPLVLLLPAWLQRLDERPSWLWNTGIGLIIGLSLLRWLLHR